MSAERRALVASLVASGALEACPVCTGDGACTPKMAARMRPGLPRVDREADTVPELPVVPAADVAAHATPCAFPAACATCRAGSEEP